MSSETKLIFSGELGLLIPCVVAFSVSFLALPPYIKWLKQQQINQFLREEGPQSHQHKAKTPTTGGVVFIFSTLVVTLAYWFWSRQSIDVSACLVLFAGIVCALVGWMDDMMKVQQKANKGISGFVRLGIETVLGLVVGLVLLALNSNVTKTLVPAGFAVAAADANLQTLVTKGSSNIGDAFFIMAPIMVFLVLATFLSAAVTNAFNLHDGMDGLAAGTGSQVLATMALLLLYSGQPALAAIAAAGAGALIGFLMHNKYPAKIFMGDTGSLFIGGLMAYLTIAGGLVLWFIPLSLIYILEALSVMAQVVYFKLTKQYTPEKPMSAPALILTKLTKRLPGEGKRLFRMAPLHHHFEAVFAERGIEEWEVVAGFWIVQAVICVSVMTAYLLWH